MAGNERTLESIALELLADLPLSDAWWKPGDAEQLVPRVLYAFKQAKEAA